MVDRKKVIDYISTHFKRNGKKVTKKSLEQFDDAKLWEIIVSKNCVDDFNAWIKIPKMIKYYGVSEEYTLERFATSKADFIEKYKNEGIEVLEVVEAKGHHWCKYCHGIANGSDSDLLCDECRTDLGHAFYSEL